MASNVQFYEYFLMLPAEVSGLTCLLRLCALTQPQIEHIWTSKWGPGNVLYVITRYLPFIEAALMVNCT